MFVDVPTIVAGEETAVQVHALDAFGNLAYEYPTQTVGALAVGSISGAFLDQPYINPDNVRVENGVGSLNVRPRILEDITFSFLDTFGTGLDVSDSFTANVIPGEHSIAFTTSSLFHLCSRSFLFSFNYAEANRQSRFTHTHTRKLMHYGLLLLP